MSSRLGRNPFEKKSAPTTAKTAAEFIKEMESREKAIPAPRVTASSSETLGSRIAHFVLVDARAEGYLFALKAYMLSLAVFT